MRFRIISVSRSVSRSSAVKHPNAKPWKGEGAGVLEVIENHRGDTWRGVSGRLKLARSDYEERYAKK